MNLLSEIREAYLYWRLIRKVRSLGMPKLAHQDDATQEELEVAMQVRSQGGKFVFAGDLPETHPMHLAAMRFVQIAVRVRNANILGGICAGCGSTHPHWPATGREMQISGWAFVNDGKPAMVIACPTCVPQISAMQQRRPFDGDD